MKEELDDMRDFFNSGITKNIDFRIKHLLNLKYGIKANTEKIVTALKTDLGKSPEEAYLTEISIVLDEIDYHIKHLKKWSRPNSVRSGIALLPSRSKIIYEPYGVILIIAPWNYPFQLLLDPLVGAISAGNCAVLKPSRKAPATLKVVSEIVSSAFPENYVSVITGEKGEMEWLLDCRFDYIFFTGSAKTGRIVMGKASSNLCPVTLELGGKSPCIVSSKFNIGLAAKRVAFGKFINAGQTCVAPDYVLIEKGQKGAFIESMGNAIKEFYGENVKSSPYFGRIITREAFDNLIDKLENSGGKIAIGGEHDRNEKYIAPTLIENPNMDSKLMQEEIFGPLLPIIEYDSIEGIIEYLKTRDKPLALYYFGDKQEARYVLRNTSSGGACVNDTILHVANKRLPFGGVGESGLGKYHGRSSFEVFSNKRSVLISSEKIDFPQKYPPYKGFRFLKKIL